MPVCELSVFRVVWCEKRYGTRESTVSKFVFQIVSIMVRQNKTICDIEILDEDILLPQLADWQPFFPDGKWESFHARIYVRYSTLLQCLNFGHEFWENSASVDWFRRTFTYKMYVGIESELEPCNMKSAGCYIFYQCIGYCVDWLWK